MLLSFVGIAMSLALWVSRLSTNQPLTIWVALYSHLVRMQIWVALSPVIVWLDRRWSAGGRVWAPLMARHFAAAVALATVGHTAVFGTLTWALTLVGFGEPESLVSVVSSIWLSNGVVGVIVYKMILTTHFTFDYYAKYREEQLRSANLEAQLSEARLQALRMQLHPHFLFNTLNSISSLILDDPHTAVRMVSRLGDFLRLTLEHDGSESVPLDREIEFLERYLEIEKIRFRDRLRVTVAVEPATLRARVPSLILQPVIENAIQHGIARRAAAGRIEVRARRIDDRLHIEILDDGPGVSSAKSNGNGHNGVGLANTRIRLDQMFPQSAHLVLASRPEGGAVATLDLPFVAMEDEHDADD